MLIKFFEEITQQLTSLSYTQLLPLALNHHHTTTTLQLFSQGICTGPCPMLLDPHLPTKSCPLPPTAPPLSPASVTQHLCAAVAFVNHCAQHPGSLKHEVDPKKSMNARPNLSSLPRMMGHSPNDGKRLPQGRGRGRDRDH